LSMPLSGFCSDFDLLRFLHHFGGFTGFPHRKTSILGWLVVGGSSRWKDGEINYIVLPVSPGPLRSWVDSSRH
jgi:hypothetical protein